MLDFTFVLWVKLPVIDRITQLQSNKFATGVENMA